MEDRFHLRLQIHLDHRLGDPVGHRRHPKTLTPLPPALGISTAFTGGGKYDPDDIRFQILYRFRSRFSSNAAIDCSSTPAAPLFAFTLRYASQTATLAIRNGLSCNLGSLTWLLPAMPVDHQANPGNPSPSLRPHYRASPLLRDGPPLCPAPVLGPSQFLLLGVLPSAGRPNTRPAPPGRQVPTFHADA